MDPATAMLAGKVVGGLLGGDAKSSAGNMAAADLIFDNAGGSISTGGDAFAPEWSKWVLAGVGVVAVILILRS